MIGLGRAGVGLRTRALVVVGLSALFSLGLGAEIGRSQRLGTALLALGLLAATAVIAVRRPSWVFDLAVVTLVLVPVYAAPTVKWLLLIPAALLLWVLGGALFVRAQVIGELLRVSLVDISAGAFFIVMMVPVAFSVRRPSEFIYNAFLWFGPYLGVRLFVSQEHAAKHFVRAVAIAGLALVPFVFYESGSGSNLFSKLDYNGPLAAIWLTPITRFAEHRVAASFGHPIALAMFLSTAAIFCAVLAIESRRRRTALMWIVGSASLVAAQALTFSRTGWVILALASALFAIRKPSVVARPRMLAAVACGVALIAVLPQAASIRKVFVSTFSESSSQSYGIEQSYRRTLLSRALEPGVLTAWGNRESHFAGSVDNEYIYLADAWGVASMLALLGLVGSVGYTVVRFRSDPIEASVPIAALANFVGLTFVALITQQQVFIWMLIGATAGLLTMRRLTRSRVYDV